MAILPISTAQSYQEGIQKKTENRELAILRRTLLGALAAGQENRTPQLGKELKKRVGLLTFSRKSEFEKRIELALAASYLKRTGIVDLDPIKSYEAYLKEADDQTILRHFVELILSTDQRVCLSGCMAVRILLRSSIREAFSTEQIEQIERVLEEIKTNRAFRNQLSEIREASDPQMDAYIAEDLQLESANLVQHVHRQRALLFTLFSFPVQFEAEKNCYAVAALTGLIDRQPMVVLTLLQELVESGQLIYDGRSISIHHLLAERLVDLPRPHLQKMLLTTFEFVSGNQLRSSNINTLTECLFDTLRTFLQIFPLTHQQIETILESLRQMFSLIVVPITPNNYPATFIHHGEKLLPLYSLPDLEQPILQVVRDHQPDLDVEPNGETLSEMLTQAAYVDLPRESDRVKWGNIQLIFDWVHEERGGKRVSAQTLLAPSPMTFFQGLQRLCDGCTYTKVPIGVKDHAFIIDASRLFLSRESQTAVLGTCNWGEYKDGVLAVTQVVLFQEGESWHVGLGKPGQITERLPDDHLNDSQIFI